MLSAISFDVLAFIALVLIASFFRWISKEAEKAKRKTEQSGPQPPRPTRVPPREETDEDRVRRFLEALGQPTSSKPPAPIEQRPRAPGEKRAITPTARKIFSPLPPLTTVPPPLPVEIEAESSIPLPVAEPAVSRVGVPIVSTKAEQLPSTAFPETIHRANIYPDVTTLLSSGRGLREAVILREILGPPRSLQTLEF